MLPFPMQNISLKNLENYAPTNILEDQATRALIENYKFSNNKDTFAIIGIGGTMSSSYSFSEETIYASNYNPIYQRLNQLQDAFNVSESNTSYISLSTKDSRDINDDEAKFIIDFIDSIDNERVILSSGTYGLPNAVLALSASLKKPKIVGVTGSLLPSSIINNDCDINTGGVVAAVNSVSTFSNEHKSKPVVFGVFHGKIYMPEDCKKLDLHPNTSKHTVAIGEGFTRSMPTGARPLG